MSSYHLIRFVLATCLITVSSAVLAQQNHPYSRSLGSMEAGKIGVREALLDQLNMITDMDVFEKHGPYKCATPTFIALQKQGLSDDPSMKAALGSATVSKNTLAESYTSASGRFVIYYETSGIDAVPAGDVNSNSVPDYVEWVAEASDSSYNHEIITLGFTDPIPAGEQYSVFIKNLGAYGLTRTNSSEPADTHIEIENDFEGFPPNDDPEGDQKGAVRVTMAHEFKHAIQYAQTAWNGESDRWAEMDATLYEEIVYDEVNDYYNYLVGFADNLFNAPGNTLIPGSYEDITWSLFFHERYGDSFWTEVWELLEADSSLPFLDVIAQNLNAYGTTYSQAVLESFIWHFTSGSDLAADSFGFEERLSYPTPSIRETITEFSTELSTELTLSKLSGNYFIIDPEVLSSGALRFSFTNSTPDVQFGLVVYDFFEDDAASYYFTDPDPGAENVFNLPDSWSEIDKVGLVVVNLNDESAETFSYLVSDYFVTNTDTLDIVTGFQLEQNYPNPFNPITNIRVRVDTPQNISLKVFDYMGREIQNLYDGTLSRGFHNFNFDGSGLASGMYFYRLESEEKVDIKKMMLVK